MIVCLCHGVCDRRIRSMVADGATSVEEIGARCGAGTGCGACRESVCAIIDEESGDAVCCARLQLINKEAA